MHKFLYGLATATIVILTGALFFGLLPRLGEIWHIGHEHLLAYTLILIGVTVLYFAYFRPHWFTKEIIPSGADSGAKQIRAMIDAKKVSGPKKPSFANDSDFWKLLPFGLFFTLGGFAYLFQPAISSLLVVLICSAWLSLLYRLV